MASVDAHSIIKSVIAGVYGYKDRLYALERINDTLLKIGHSQDMEHRGNSADTFKLSKDSFLNNIAAVIHSPSYAKSGTRLLEKLVHYFYRANRIEKEFFEWKGIQNYIFQQDVLDFLESKNITDAQIYTRLKDVPRTLRTIQRCSSNEGSDENENEIEQQDYYDEKITKRPRIDVIAKPLPFQQDIVEKACQYFKSISNSKGCLFLPPGFGKTYITGFALEILDFDRVLILTPQIMIGQEWKKMFDKLHVKRKVIVISSEDENISLVNFPEKYYLICTYQSYCANPELFLSEYSMIVYDEAHHLVTGTTLQTSITNLTGKNLFLTATPKIVHVDTETEEEFIYSMDNPELFGRPIHQENLETSIQAGILCDYRILIYKEDIDEETKVTEEQSDDEMDSDDNDEEEQEEESKTTVNVNTVPHITMLSEVYGRKHILVFYNACKHALEAHQYLQEHTLFKSFYMDGTTSKRERHKMFDEFEQPSDICKVLFNVQVVSEGVSIPCIDAILLMETRSSSIVLTQMIGRVLRTFPGKTESIICIPERCTDTLQTVLESTFYESINSTKSTTDRILVENTNIVERKALIVNVQKKLRTVEILRQGGIWQHKFNLCKQFEESTGKTIQLRTEFEGVKIGFWLDTNKTGYVKTKALAKQASGQALSEREDKKLKRHVKALTSDQIDRLCQLSTWKKWETTKKIERSPWDDTFNLCQQYEESTGKTIQSTTKFEGVQIGQWLDRNKLCYDKTNALATQASGQALSKREEKQLKYLAKALTSEQIDRLCQLSTWKKWEATEKVERLPWDGKFNLCKQYEESTGKTIQSTTKFNGVQIGGWLQNNIRCYLKTKALAKQASGQALSDKEQKLLKFNGKALTSEQIDQLCQLSTWKKWDTERVERVKLPWDDNFNLCKQYEESTGKTIQKQTEFKGVKIGNWYFKTKNCYHKTKALAKQASGQALSEKEQKQLKIKGKPLTSEQIDRLCQLSTWTKWEAQQ